MTPPPPIILICCSVFEAEVEHLRQLYWPNLALRFQSSMLHMRPQALGASLKTRVDHELAQGHHVVLIYGDCSLAMASLEERPGVVRTRGTNCCEMLLGHDEYRRLVREGVYFLLPEWAHRWQEIFTHQLGLNHENAASLMGDMHRKLLYLDTGIVPVPHDALHACSQYCGLPYQIQGVSLDHLRGIIDEALLRLPNAGNLA